MSFTLDQQNLHIKAAVKLSSIRMFTEILSESSNDESKEFYQRMKAEAILDYYEILQQLTEKIIPAGAENAKFI